MKKLLAKIPQYSQKNTRVGSLDLKKIYIENICKRLEAVARRCSSKKGVLTNFMNCTGKHLRQSLFFNKVAGQAWLVHTTSLKA